jgi:hypothetical protein
MSELANTLRERKSYWQQIPAKTAVDKRTVTEVNAESVECMERAKIRSRVPFKLLF